MNKRNAKIVATLGPASSGEEVLKKLILAGLDVARLNFSHGDHASHGETIALIRKLSAQLNRPVTILQDLQGPKMRVGQLPPEGVELVSGQRVALTKVKDRPPSLQESGAKVHIPLDVPELAESVKPGNFILLDDGHLELKVTRVEGTAVYAEVILGGRLTSNKGLNLPGVRMGIPGFTEKDRVDLEFGLEQGVDALAISFVRSGEDIENVRKVIEQISPRQADMPIIAKLELPEAIENMEEITLASDGVMVARGDLAVETSPAIVPILQKKMIDVANRNARYVITATQMLESMINNPRPTRAEASDVANAILDGTDAVMLSAESAVGRFPVESVMMMSEIVRKAEMNMGDWGRPSRILEHKTADDAISTVRAAREMAADMNVVHIAVLTRSGATALYMSKARPSAPILAFTPEMKTYQRLSMYWGVTPFLVPFTEDVETMLAYVNEAIRTSTDMAPGQQVVVVSGFPVSSFSPPNLALLHTVPEQD
jgi:pyruvate kinase